MQAVSSHTSAACPAFAVVVAVDLALALALALAFAFALAVRAIERAEHRRTTGPESGPCPSAASLGRVPRRPRSAGARSGEAGPDRVWRRRFDSRHPWRSPFGPASPFCAAPAAQVVT